VRMGCRARKRLKISVEDIGERGNSARAVTFSSSKNGATYSFCLADKSRPAAETVLCHSVEFLLSEVSLEETGALPGGIAIVQICIEASKDVSKWDSPFL